MSAAQYAYCSAGDLIDDLRAGRISSVELTRNLITRVKANNEPINAVITLAEEDALRQAAEADARQQRGDTLGPLHGLPMTLKDTWEVAAMPCTAGAPALKDYIPKQHADLVQRLIQAGAIILGKTNVPLYAMDLQSYNKVFGVTNNPYQSERTPGGSSGGAAAALASGCTPLEVGSDLAGSIRTPAHFCGIFGHKTTRDLISMRGHIPGPPGTQSQPDLVSAGPMARSASDLERLLEVIAGPRHAEERSWKLAMEPPRIRSLKEARVGLWLEDALCPVDKALADAHRQLGSDLTRHGSIVADAKHPLLDMNQILPPYFNLLGSMVGAALKKPQRRQMAWIARLHPLLKHLGPITPHIDEYARGVNQHFYEWAGWHEWREKMRSQGEEIFAEHDVLLTPVSPTVAFEHNHQMPVFKRRIMINGKPHAYMDQFCWIAFATLLGLPATSVPIGRDKDGLPFNIQVIGAPGTDLTTIHFGHLMEQAGLAGFSPPPDFS